MWVGVSVMSKNLEVSVLFDFYGEMLTEKQKDVIDLYYNEDLSLAEIAEHEGISRQGVRDNIKRGEVFLYELEDKIGYVRQYRATEKLLDELQQVNQQLYMVNEKYVYNNEIRLLSEKLDQMMESYRNENDPKPEEER